jgi:predicted nucleic acid-binding protein
VIAELDYLVASRVGIAAEIQMLNEVAGGAYDLAAFDRDELLTAAQVIERYEGQAIGVADASLVVLARRYATRTILTLDRRHFDVVRPLDGGHFKIVP